MGSRNYGLGFSEPLATSRSKQGPKRENNYNHYFGTLSRCAKMIVEVNPWSKRVLVWICTSEKHKQLIAELDDLRQYHLWLAKEYDDGIIVFEEDQ